MNDVKKMPIYRKDYAVFDYTVEHLQLKFELYEEATIVTAHAAYRKNPLSKKDHPPLLLFGEKLELLAISMDGMELPADRYDVDDKGMRLGNPPPAFTLTIVTQIYPASSSQQSSPFRED